MSMSASAAQIPMANVGWQPTSPLGALAQWNEVQKGGLQNTGLGLANQQAQLMLGLRGQLAGTVGVGPNGQPLAPGQAPPGGMMGAMPPGGMPGGGMPGGDPGVAGGAPGGGGGPNLQMVSPYAAMTPWGVPAPRALVIGAVMSNDPSKAMADIYNMGRQRVTELLTQAGNVNDPDPAKAAQAQAQTRANAGVAYSEGWLAPSAYQQLMSDPAKGAQFVRSMASPDEHLKAATQAGLAGMTTDSNGNMVFNPDAAAGLAAKSGMVSGAEERARVAPRLALKAGEQSITNLNTLTEIPVTNDGGKTYQMQPLTQQQKLNIVNGGAAPGAAGGGNAASALTGATPQPGSQPGASPYAAWNNQHEGGAPGVKNTRSTATGTGQFTEQPWLETIKQAMPEFAAGKTDEQLLALRNDTGLSNAMTDALAVKNAAALKAQNLPNTIDKSTGQPYNGAVGLSHFFGAAGAGKILGADGATPMTTLFPPDVDGKPNPIIAANPRLANQTAADVVRPYADAFGRQAYSPPGAAAATSPASSGGGGASIQSAPVPTKATEGVIAADNKRLDEDAGLIKTTQDAKIRANAAQTNLLDARGRIDTSGAGAGGEWRALIGNYVATYAPAPDVVKKLFGLDPNSLVDQQTLIKELTNMVTATEANQPNTRFGAQLNAYYAKGSPSIGQQPQTIHEMLNNMLVANQMVRDYGNDAADHYNHSRESFQADPVSTRYSPMTVFDQSWGGQNSLTSPSVYAAAEKALNGKPYGDYSKGLSAQQVSAALAITARADPNARALKPDGTWVQFHPPQTAAQ